ILEKVMKLSCRKRLSLLNINHLLTTCCEAGRLYQFTFKRNRAMKKTYAKPRLVQIRRSVSAGGH
ncbi:hypothetical protein, partial [Rahnella aceris]|uniref:hypothetical protein n=1 Tax=Rahnella sp. (strain Y9602) TaxID=2703885 RepID=UPI001C27075A